MNNPKKIWMLYYLTMEVLNMKEIIKAIREKVITFSLIAAMMIGIMPANAFAAENVTWLIPIDFESNSLVGTTREEEWFWPNEKTVAVGNNNGTIEFTDQYTSPLITVGGNYVRMSGFFTKPSFDAGLGDIVLTIGLKDEMGNLIAGPWPIHQMGITTPINTPKWGLYRPGIKIRLWLDASSAGTSNGHFRSARVFGLYASVSDN